MYVCVLRAGLELQSAEMSASWLSRKQQPGGVCAHGWVKTADHASALAVVTAAADAVVAAAAEAAAVAAAEAAAAVTAAVAGATAVTAVAAAAAAAAERRVRSWLGKDG